jgi:glycine hydroxymethyltransferase
LTGDDEARAKAELSGWWDTLSRAAADAERALNLVPSECRMSPLARQPLKTDFYNRYFFNNALKDDFWEFRGAEDIGAFERDLVIPSLLELGRPPAGDIYVNVRPLSGLSAMQIAVLALAGRPGTPVGYVARGDGGHFATESLIGRLGFAPRAVRFNRGQPDEESFHQVLGDGKPKLLYLDLMNFTCEVDVAGAVALAKSISPSIRVHVDVSHTLGLILGGVLTNPLAVGADSFGGSTHKTFPGPQKGVLFTSDLEVSQAFDEAQIDMVSSHHFAETLALGLAAAEFRFFGAAYARQVVSNAKDLAAALISQGFTIRDPDEIATHQLWMPPTPDMSIWDFTQVLQQASIRLNIQSQLPGVPGPCIRLGTNEVTFLGARSNSMTLLAEAFAEARDKGACKPVTVDRIWDSFGEPYYIQNVSL